MFGDFFREEGHHEEAPNNNQSHNYDALKATMYGLRTMTSETGTHMSQDIMTSGEVCNDCHDHVTPNPVTKEEKPATLSRNSFDLADSMIKMPEEKTSEAEDKEDSDLTKKMLVESRPINNDSTDFTSNLDQPEHQSSVSGLLDAIPEDKDKRGDFKNTIFVLYSSIIRHLKLSKEFKEMTTPISEILQELFKSSPPTSSIREPNGSYNEQFTKYLANVSEKLNVNDKCSKGIAAILCLNPHYGKFLSVIAVKVFSDNKLAVDWINQTKMKDLNKTESIKKIDQIKCQALTISECLEECLKLRLENVSGPDRHLFLDLIQEKIYSSKSLKSFLDQKEKILEDIKQEILKIKHNNSNIKIKDDFDYLNKEIFPPGVSETITKPKQTHLIPKNFACKKFIELIAKTVVNIYKPPKKLTHIQSLIKPTVEKFLDLKDERMKGYVEVILPNLKDRKKLFQEALVSDLECGKILLKMAISILSEEDSSKVSDLGIPISEDEKAKFKNILSEMLSFLEEKQSKIDAEEFENLEDPRKKNKTSADINEAGLQLEEDDESTRISSDKQKTPTFKNNNSQILSRSNQNGPCDFPQSNDDENHQHLIFGKERKNEKTYFHHNIVESPEDFILHFNILLGLETEENRYINTIQRIRKLLSFAMRKILEKLKYASPAQDEAKRDYSPLYNFIDRNFLNCCIIEILDFVNSLYKCFSDDTSSSFGQIGVTLCSNRSFGKKLLLIMQFILESENLALYWWTDYFVKEKFEEIEFQIMNEELQSSVKTIIEILQMGPN